MVVYSVHILSCYEPGPSFTYVWNEIRNFNLFPGTKRTGGILVAQRLSQTFITRITVTPVLIQAYALTNPCHSII